MDSAHPPSRERLMDEVVRPIFAAAAVGFMLDQGGANWWFSFAGGYAVLVVITTIWKATARGE